MARIYLTRLQLTDFRNWKSLCIDCDRRHVVLFGENGTGKTNILEAISFLSPGRGLRRAAYETVARAGGPGTWSVFARIEGFRGQVSIGTGIQDGPAGIENQRRVRIDAAPARNSEDLMEHARIGWLFPAMDGLFAGPASERRRFLDRLVLAIDPGHGRRVTAFERSMRARNRLLGGPAPDPSWLGAIEAQMAEAGVAITIARLELLGLLEAAIRQGRDASSLFPDASVELSPGIPGMADQAASDIEAAYCELLAEQRSADMAAGRTAAGPHRADLKVMHVAKEMEASRCSTGEQKALLVAIVLASARVQSEDRGVTPIVLLDEVAAHLDARHRSALFDAVAALDVQAWYAGTDRAVFEPLRGRAQFFAVESAAAMAFPWEG